MTVNGENHDKNYQCYFSYQIVVGFGIGFISILTFIYHFSLTLFGFNPKFDFS